MTFIHLPREWNLPESAATPESAFLQRRRLLAQMAGAGAGVLLGATSPADAGNSSRWPKKVRRNPRFASAGRPLTPRRLAERFNNFYEFGTSKNIWRAAQALPTDPWTVHVRGQVRRPSTFDLDDLRRKFPLEERIYRFRCVEAWSMVVPWVGFPMKALMDAVEPTSKARFVRFTSLWDAKVMPGAGSGGYPWPYTEGLTIREMANELAFFAIGAYGQPLTKQQGAPIREVIPWKYGFKGAKSIVRIDFLDHQPATFWNTLIPHEYDFQANVNPKVPHPRWSQATERVLGPGAMSTWERRPTLLYNGYGKWVAELYGKV